MSKLLSIFPFLKKKESKKYNSNKDFVKIFPETESEFIRGHLYIRGYKHVNAFREAKSKNFKICPQQIYDTIYGKINHIQTIVAFYEEGIDFTPRLTERQLKRFQKLAREKGVLA
jgi:hypothetical protein